MKSFSTVAALTAACAASSGCGHDGPSGTPPSPPAATATPNVWKSEPVDPRRLPLGDRFVTRTAPGVGALFMCRIPERPRPPAGASLAGPWIDAAGGTWDLTAKLQVGGRVEWPTAQYGESIERGVRTLVTNGLPTRTVTGTFPIAPSDPAYRYDRNPNAIAPVALRAELPVEPAATAAAACLPQGPIALLRNGVPLYAPVDELDRDAVAWETQDSCQGHPQQQGSYHYHDVSQCLRDAATATSTVVGWAFDGHPIVIERDEGGRLPGNDDLDECHGRTSDVRLEEGTRAIYHYSVTLEFPYAIGCFRSAPVSSVSIAGSGP